MKLIRSAPLTGGGTVSGDLTVEGDFVVEGGGSLTVDHAVTGNATLTSATTWSPVLKLDNTNADATSAKFQFFKSATASEADDDYIGLIDFWGVDDGDAATRYAYIAGITSDVTGGTEDGRLEFHTIGNATEAARLILDANSRISLSNNDLGGSNTVFGNLAGAGIISGGDSNSLFGDAAGKNLTTGAGNVAIGFQTLDQATTETDNNVAIGYQAMHGSITTEAVNDCVAIGSNALDGPLEEEVSGTVAIGKAALGALTDGARNTSIGYQSMLTGQSSGDNTMVGYNTGYQMGTGSLYNTVLGSKAFSGNQTNNDSNYCVAIGYLALSGALDSITNGAVAIGGNALQALTTGGSNVGIGFYALKNLTEGSDNTAIGHNAFSAAGAGESNNIAIGSAALGLADEGTGSGNAIDGNIAIGKDALSAADFGSTGSRTLLSNIAIGNNALNSTSTNSMTGTIAIGEDALTALTSGARSTAVGYRAGVEIDIGDRNTMIGYAAMGDSLAGLQNDDNTFVGDNCGGGTWVSNASSDNVGVGSSALAGAMNGGGENTAIGAFAFKALTSADENTALGFEAGTLVTTGSANTLIGSKAGSKDITGSGNVAVGKSALNNLYGSSNVAIGREALEGTTFQDITCDYDPADSGNERVIGHNANAAIIAGLGVSGDGIPDGAYIVSIDSGTQFTISANTTGGSAFVNETLTFYSRAEGTVAIGYSALTALTSGVGNIAIGYEAMDANQQGSYNLAIGQSALGGMNDDGSSSNIAIGSYAMDGVTALVDCQHNTMIGVHAGGGSWANNASTHNVGVGNYVMDSAMDGALRNTAIGYGALSDLASGDENIAVGYGAGDAITTGYGNTFIGSNADADDAGNNYLLRMGHYGALRYMTVQIELDDFTNADTDNRAAKAAFLKIPRYGFLKRVVVTTTVASGGTGQFNVSLATDDVISGAALSNRVELIGADSTADSDFTGATLRQSTLSADGDTQVNLNSAKFVHIWESDQATDDSSGWTLFEAQARWLYVCHANTSNADASPNPNQTIRMTAEYWGEL